MNLNADFTRRALVKSHDLPWVDSPLPGVQRRMLDRIGDEVARATSIVRYAPGSYFSPHTHDGGEEFLVLEGVFSDEHGDYGSGTYVRNPVGSSHKPYSANGCTIFVKLWQLQKDDQEFVRLDTNAMAWQGSVSGDYEIKPLAQRSYENVSLIRLSSDTVIENFGHEHGSELLVFDGELSDDDIDMPAGSWLRNPPGCFHRLSCKQDAVAYLKTGHLSAAHFVTIR